MYVCKVLFNNLFFLTEKMDFKGRYMIGSSRILWQESEFLCLYYQVRMDVWKRPKMKSARCLQ